MNTTSQESGKYGDGRSTTGAGTKMSPEGQSDPMSTQSTSMGSQTGSAGSTGTQSGGIGIHSGSQTPGQNTQRGNMQNWRGGRSEAQQHAEGPIAMTIENQTAKLPSDLFLWPLLPASAYPLYWNSPAIRRNPALSASGWHRSFC